MLLLIAELLDVEEFMQPAGNHEDSLNSAANLGLMVSDIINKNSRTKSHMQTL